MAPALPSPCGTVWTRELEIILLAYAGRQPSLRLKPSFMLRQRHSLPNFAAGLLTCLCTLSLAFPGASAELSPPTSAAGTEDSPAGAPALEEALRQLKEQQASTFQALDLIRIQTESALLHNSSVLSNQLAQFSTALAGNSEIQLQFMRDTERRTLQVTLLILLAVLLGVGGVVLVAARTFQALAKRLPIPAPAPGRVERSAGRVESPGALVEQAATSAYKAALLEVETRIAALERRPAPVFSVGPSAPVPARRSPSAAARAPTPAKPGSSTSLAMALGDGQAIVFLPREQAAGAGGRIRAFLHRVGRLFAPGKSSAPIKPLPRPRPVKC
jgi:hypothetical protein